MSEAPAELDAEGLARLRTRYAEVVAAIDRRAPDPERREQLKTEAERLNPDGWATPDEVRRGLGQYEAVLQSLRSALGRRRRRRRAGIERPTSGNPGSEVDGAGEGPPVEDAVASEPGTGPSQN